MSACIIPGSFDPVTKGHTELFKAAAKLFDKVYAVILVNSEKKGGFFTPEQRLQLLKSAVSVINEECYGKIESLMYTGLTTDCALELGATHIAKGVRNTNDFAYEYDLAQISKRFAPVIETVFIPSSPELACVSSTYVRELIKYGKLESPDFADGTAELIKEYINK